MNQEIKTKWVAALRAIDPIGPENPNKKAKTIFNFALHPQSPDGVLCELYMKEYNLSWQIKDGQYSLFGRAHAIPDQVKDWAGLDRYDPLLPSMNQTKHKSNLSYWSVSISATVLSYNELADHIEASL